MCVCVTDMSFLKTIVDNTLQAGLNIAGNTVAAGGKVAKNTADAGKGIVENTAGAGGSLVTDILKKFAVPLAVLGGLLVLVLAILIMLR